jgi:hypothetical protein
MSEINDENPVNENLNQVLNNNDNNNEQNPNPHNNQNNNNMSSFSDRLTSKDVLEFCNDFFPSVTVNLVIFFSIFVSGQVPCFIEFPKFLITMSIIYLLFMIRGISRFLFIYINKINETWVKILFNASDGIFLL